MDQGTDRMLRQGCNGRKPAVPQRIFLHTKNRLLPEATMGTHPSKYSDDHRTVRYGTVLYTMTYVQREPKPWCSLLDRQPRMTEVWWTPHCGLSSTVLLLPYNTCYRHHLWYLRYPTTSRSAPSIPPPRPLTSLLPILRGVVHRLKVGKAP